MHNTVIVDKKSCTSYCYKTMLWTGFDVPPRLFEKGFHASPAAALIQSMFVLIFLAFSLRLFHVSYVLIVAELDPDDT